jgi:integrase
MTIVQLPSGSWHWQVSTGRRIVSSNGKVRYGRVTGTTQTRREAEQAQARAKLTAQTSTMRGTTDPTVGEWLLQWLDSREGDLERYTLAGYRSKADLYLIPELGRVRLSELRVSHVERMLAVMRDKGLAAATMRQTREVLAGALAVAERREMIASNPARKALVPKSLTPQRKHAPPDQGGALDALRAAEQVGPLASVVVTLALHTGARRGELAALRWSDLVDGHLTIARAVSVADGQWEEKSTKSESVRRMPLTPAVAAALEEHRARQAELCELAEAPEPVWILSVIGDMPLSPFQVSGLWERTRKLCKLDKVRLHDLRHFVATQLMAAGVPVTEVAERLGHRDSSVTLRVYSHSTDEGQQRATDVLGDLLKPAD